MNILEIVNAGTKTKKGSYAIQLTDRNEGAKGSIFSANKSQLTFYGFMSSPFPEGVDQLGYTLEHAEDGSISKVTLVHETGESAVCSVIYREREWISEKTGETVEATLKYITIEEIYDAEGVLIESEEAVKA